MSFINTSFRSQTPERVCALINKYFLARVVLLLCRGEGAIDNIVTWANTLRNSAGPQDP